MLSTAAVIEEVLFTAAPGHPAVAEQMRPGAVLVVMSSIPVEACRSQRDRLQTAGVEYVDAPVSGGERGARDGTLAILRRRVCRGDCAGRAGDAAVGPVDQDWARRQRPAC